MDVFLCAVNRVFCAETTNDFQFLVVHVAGDDLGATHDGTNDSTNAHHTATDNHDGVGIDDLCAANGVETNAHRLDKCGVLDGNRANRDDLLPGYSDVLTHGTIALNAERLIVLAGIVTAVTARRAVTAVGVGIDGDGHAHAKMRGSSGTDGSYGGADFMAGDDGHLHHRVQATIGV